MPQRVCSGLHATPYRRALVLLLTFSVLVGATGCSAAGTDIVVTEEASTTRAPSASKRIPSTPGEAHSQSGRPAFSTTPGETAPAPSSTPVIATDPGGPELLPQESHGFFTGLWTTSLSDSHPLETDPSKNGTADADGRPYAARFAAQARYHSDSSPVAGLYAPGYSTIITEGAPLYVIPPGDHPTRTVTWMLSNGEGPEAPLDAADGLQHAFMDVPIPVGPNGERFEQYYGRDIAGAGSDQQVAIYKPETGEMWEMWLFTHNPHLDRYEMGYGGYTRDVRTAPEALPHQWGARATSLPLIAGVMLNDEYASGGFHHPLSVAIPVVKPNAFLAPATREDGYIVAHTVGHDARDAVPEGAWFRLPPDYVIDESKPPLWQMIVRAARDYGIVVADGTGGSMSFAVEDDRTSGTPYARWPAQTLPGDPYYWGPENVLNTFPWESLVQLSYTP
jgi:hypothetical protein